MRKPSFFYPLFLLICWTGFAGAGTYALVETTMRQYLAVKYATTQGKIVRSEVGQGPISRRGIEIAYNYMVNGVKYTGHRYRYDDHNIALEWESTVTDNPRWSFKTVHYNPENPADSLLEPGINGCDWLLLLFALPLNVLSYILWGLMIRRLRESSRIESAGGVRIFKRSGETRVSMEQTSALAAGLYGSATAAFIGAFPAVIVGGFEPKVPFMKTIWAVVLAVGAVVFVWRAVRNKSGIYDLRIDQASQMITLPQTEARQQCLSVARREISGVSMQRRVSKSPSGTSFSYLPALKRNGPPAEVESLKLIKWGWSEEKAQAFSQWLSQELGVEFKGVEEEIAGGAAKS